MTTSRRHPRASGVADWIEFKLTPAQADELARLMRGWCRNDLAWSALVGETERAITLYHSTKRLAEKSSAGQVRQNLRAAVSAADKLLHRLNALDGNSLALVRQTGYPGWIKQEAADILVALANAETVAKERFTMRGRRPLEERDTLAALLLHLVRRHTTLEPTATEGKPFESFLRLALSFAGEPSTDLHQLARRALGGAMHVDEQVGLLSITPANPD